MSVGLDIEGEASPSQVAFLESTASNTFFEGGYGAGKTWVLVEAMVLGAGENQGKEMLLAADTFGRLSRDVLPQLMERLDTCGLGWSWRPQSVPGLPKRCMIIGPGIFDTPLHIGSAEHPSSIKGLNVAAAFIEEAPLMPRKIPGSDELVFNVIRSRLRVKGGTLRLKCSGTPEGVSNWTCDAGMFHTPPTDPAGLTRWMKDFRVIRGSSYENAANLPDGYVEQMASTMDPAQVLEKVWGVPTAGGTGRCYYAFSRAKNVGPVRYHRRRGRVIIGQDYNVNPMVAILMQYADGKFWVFGEITLPDSNTPAMAEALRRRLALIGLSPADVDVWPDASGRSRKTTGVSDHVAMRNAGFTRLRFKRSGNPPVRDRVLATNGAMHHGRYLIDPSCTGLITDFLTTERDEFGGPKKTGDKSRTHHTDAGTYPVIGIEPVRKRGGIGAAM